MHLWDGGTVALGHWCNGLLLHKGVGVFVVRRRLSMNLNIMLDVRL